MHRLSKLSRNIIITINNHRLGSAGDNDRWSKHSVAPMLCFAYLSINRMVKTRMDQIMQSRRWKRMWSNCILCIPSFLSGSPNECWLHTCDACIITTWRLGLLATRGARISYYRLLPCSPNFLSLIWVTYILCTCSYYLHKFPILL